MDPFSYLAEDAEFESWLAALPTEGATVGVDLEAEFNLHIYGEHFCLLQLFDGQRAAAVDPQAVSIALIKGFLEDRGVEKITYDSISDRALLYKNHGILMQNLVDLRPAVELLEFKKQGLGGVVEAALGIAPARRKKRFQQYNWTRRPINAEALQYAIDDVRHLFALRDALFERLAEADLMEQYQQRNAKIQQGRPDTDRKPGMLRSSRFRRLSSAQKRLLERLYDEREQVARQVNLPPNTVFPNTALFALAQGQRGATRVRRSRNMPQGPFEQLLRRMRELAEKR